MLNRRQSNQQFTLTTHIYACSALANLNALVVDFEEDPFLCSNIEWVQIVTAGAQRNPTVDARVLVFRNYVYPR
jgi:hypothetical protein